jgi:hypothetical protein
LALWLNQQKIVVVLHDIDVRWLPRLLGCATDCVVSAAPFDAFAQGGHLSSAEVEVFDGGFADTEAQPACKSQAFQLVYQVCSTQN